MTLHAFIHRYWLPGKQRQFRPTTLESYQRILRLHILPALGHVTLRDLRVDHPETLYTRLLSAGRHDGTGGLSAKSVHEVHMVLRAIGDHAVRHGLLAASPVRLAIPPFPHGSVATTIAGAWPGPPMSSLTSSPSAAAS